MKRLTSVLKTSSIFFLLAEIVFYLFTRNINFPEGFSLLSLNIKFYGLLIALATATGYLISREFAKHNKISLDDFDNFFIIVLIFGIIGARLGFVLFDNSGSKTFHDMITINQGGLSIQGAVAGGLIGSLIFKLIFKRQISQLLGLIMPSVLLAQAVGRLGNYFNQELFGLATNWRFGLKISDAKIPLELYGAQKFLPSFLFESILLVIAYLIYLSLSKKVNGIKYYLIAYGFIRLFVQFTRFDHQNIVWILDFAQIFSLLMIVFALIIFKNNPKENAAK